MRIFQAIHNATNPGVPGSLTWYRNLHEPLGELGHEVTLFSTEEGDLACQRKDAGLRAQFSQKLLDAFRQEHDHHSYDLFFSYLTDGMIEVDAIDEIRRLGVPTCNFSCNNAHQFYLVQNVSPHFDYNLHSEKDARAKFLTIGANPLWWPMASNPKYFKPFDVPRTIEASFVGANYALRARYVAHLLQNGVDVHAFGPGWLWATTSAWRSVAKRIKYLLLTATARSAQAQYAASAQLADHDFRRSLAVSFPENVHPPVSDEELIALYSRSHVSLGFLEVYDRHEPSRPVTQHLHLREFEAPMSGALYCTGYTDELAEMFEPDKEVLVYRNQHELLEKVRYCLAHPEQAEQVRQAGRKRALAEHTYHARFRTLFESLGL
ncbi:MAG: glycosyltransferase [Chloroflexi bacterium]|nr:glycosyltransferase [Chloroflexota bacterium]